MSKSKSQVKSSTPVPSKGAFDAKRFATSGVSEDEVNNIKAAFDLFDSDQGGTIDIKGTSFPMQSSRQP